MMTLILAVLNFKFLTDFNLCYIKIHGLECYLFLDRLSIRVKFLDRQVWANSADPDQTAPRSGSALFVIPSASFGPITLW